MNKVGGYLRLMRPVNCVMVGFAVLIGALLVGVKDISTYWLSLTYGFVTGFSLTAASMTINDYYDRAIDSINEPQRPIPSGVIKPKEALIFATILTVIGFSSAYLTNLFCLLVAIFAWAVFAAYTIVGKRSGLPGNLLVSTCVATPFIYGSIAVLGVIRLNVLVFASIAFLANTGREITKGIVDVEGDKVQNVKTLAARYGERTAAFAAVFFYLFAVAMSPVPWLLMVVSFWFVPLVAVTDAGLVYSSVMLLRDFSRGNARRVKNTVLLWLLVGLMAFAAGAM